MLGVRLAHSSSECTGLILKGQLCVLTYLSARGKGPFKKENYRDRVMGTQ